MEKSCIDEVSDNMSVFFGEIVGNVIKAVDVATIAKVCDHSQGGGVESTFVDKIYRSKLVNEGINNLEE